MIDEILGSLGSKILSGSSMSSSTGARVSNVIFGPGQMTSLTSGISRGKGTTLGGDT